MLACALCFMQLLPEASQTSVFKSSLFLRWRATLFCHVMILITVGKIYLSPCSRRSPRNAYHFSWFFQLFIFLLRLGVRHQLRSFREHLQVNCHCASYRQPLRVFRWGRYGFCDVTQELMVHVHGLFRTASPRAVSVLLRWPPAICERSAALTPGTILSLSNVWKNLIIPSVFSHLSIEC